MQPPAAAVVNFERCLAPARRRWTPVEAFALEAELAAHRELPKLLLSTYPAEVPLQKPYDDRGFHASPAERMRLLLRQTGVRTGLVANGGEWLLVHVPADRTATFVTWYTNLLIEERITLRALPASSDRPGVPRPLSPTDQVAVAVRRVDSSRFKAWQHLSDDRVSIVRNRKAVRTGQVALWLSG